MVSDWRASTGTTAGITSRPAHAIRSFIGIAGTQPTHTRFHLDPTLDNGNGINYIASNSNRQPYSQNYTLGFQFLLPKNTTLSVSYVGNKGTRLGAQDFNNLNQLNPKYLSLGDALLDDISLHPNIPLPYPSFTGSVAQALLPYPQYAGGSVITRSRIWGRRIMTRRRWC